ncbi:MAG TPA: hypothetical protein VK084_03010 [Chitinophagaceae bacterium]|nr:hypothetical protein [Chitinophagaceae bacterium]
MKRIILMGIAGIFVVTTALAQVKQDTPQLRNDNPAFTDTLPTDTMPNQQQIPPNQTESSKTNAHHPWTSKKQNRNVRRDLDTSSPEVTSPALNPQTTEPQKNGKWNKMGKHQKMETKRHPWNYKKQNRNVRGDLDTTNTDMDTTSMR